VVGETGKLKTWSATVTGGGTLTYNWQFTQAFKPTGPGTACNDCRFDRRVFTSTSATPKMRLGLPGLHSGFLTVSNSMGASDPFFFVYTIGSWGGDRDIPLDVVVIKNNATTYPQAIGGLTAWSKEGFESWVDLYVDDAFLPSGINLKVTDYREVIDATYYRLDSGAEDTSFINTYWPQNQPFRLTMYVVDSLHDAQGWMYDNDCDLISDNRGCVWSGTNSRAYDVNTAAHELGHILSLPHIRTTTNPLTNANYNLMSYGTDELSCCICISREENLGACSAGQLHSENPHHQYTVMADYVETYM